MSIFMCQSLLWTVKLVKPDRTNIPAPWGLHSNWGGKWIICSNQNAFVRFSMLERNKSHGKRGKQSKGSGIRSAGADGMQQ